MWSPRRSTIDADSKSLSTTKDSTENEMDSHFLQEAPMSEPQTSEDCPWFFQRGPTLFGASFNSVDKDGAAGIDEVVLLETPRQKAKTSSQELKDYYLHFESQEVQHRDNALDRMRSFGGNLLPFERRSGDSGDESTESDEASLDPPQSISRPRQDASDGANFEYHDVHTVNCNSTANRVPEPEQSEKTPIALTKSSKREASTRTKLCLENNDGQSMNKDGVLLQDERRAHYAANWIKANKMFQEVLPK